MKFWAIIVLISHKQFNAMFSMLFIFVVIDLISGYNVNCVSCVKLILMFKLFNLIVF